jgi:hypothetical protein
VNWISGVMGLGALRCWVVIQYLCLGPGRGRGVRRKEKTRTDFGDVEIGRERETNTQKHRRDCQSGM